MSYQTVKRHGATRPAHATTTNVKAAPSFNVGRRALYDLLSQYCFGKIIEMVEMPATNTRTSFFHGKVLVVTNSYFQQSTSKNQTTLPEHLYFDKAGRQKSMLSIGPVKLIDTAQGLHHKSSVPQLGELLIGLKVENTNEKRSKTQPFIFRSWSMNGKIILELFRMVQYGTKMSDLEIRPLFRQSAGIVAQKVMDASGESLPFEQRVAMCKCVKAVDDIYVLAKMILWGNMRLLSVLHCQQSKSTLRQVATDAENDAAKDLRISASSLDFVRSISQKLNDDKIMEHFMDSFMTFDSGGNDEPFKKSDAPLADAPWKPYPSPPAPTTITEAVYDYNTNTNTYESKGATTPTYAPSSPLYGHNSPHTYAPSSPTYQTTTDKDGDVRYGMDIESTHVKVSPSSPSSPSSAQSPEEPPHSDSSDSDSDSDGDKSPIEPPPPPIMEIATQKPLARKSRWGDASVSQILKSAL